MRLYIIRHGETDWNLNRKAQGSTDIPLNAFGFLLAEQTARGMRDIKLDLAITSPLIRAKATAECIVGERQIPVMIDDRIQEIDFGEWEGTTGTPGNMRAKAFFQDPGRYVAPVGGESIRQLLDRTGEFYKYLCATSHFQDKHILISTSCGAMTALYNNMVGNLNPASFWDALGFSPNCSVTIAEVKNGQAKIIDKHHIYHNEQIKSIAVGTGK